MAVSSTVLSCPTMLGRIRSTAAEMRTLRSGAKCQLSTTKPSKYSSKFSTDVQLHESPQALFDEYLEDKSRVFKAMFPDKPKSYRLNEEEWRIHMSPINFLFLTARPVLNMMKWELQGLGQVMEQSDFTLGVQGALYPDRGGRHTRLKGRLEMNISFVLPPVLAFVPEDVKRSVANAILTGLVDSMKHKVIESMLADYNRFKNERKTHN
ncbi:BnaC04g31620D [Brassica napus]|uniref:BnaC04g31620D protein n=1 Tax=Brassica napus TaxID=3708 RepID=A0A078GXL9_BRANA|nr:BnaC04g31620D [Brassica napus]